MKEDSRNSSEGINAADKEVLFEYVLSMGDDLLVLGHRLSEWCAYGPLIEEDIAISNIALDCLGQAQFLLRFAGSLEGQGRDEDRLAYFRDALEFRSCRLTELPNGHFGTTILRQYFFSVYQHLLYEQLSDLEQAPAELRAIAEKSKKETAYHLRHSAEWVIRLGQGTTESAEKMAEAFETLLPYLPDLFEPVDGEGMLAETRAVIHRATLYASWRRAVEEMLHRAGISHPRPLLGERFSEPPPGGRRGLHSEHLGPMLAEMQILPRSYPDASW